MGHFYNYRGGRPRDRLGVCAAGLREQPRGQTLARQRTQGFPRARLDLDFVTMTGYAEFSAHVKVAFPKPPKMVNIGGEYLIPGSG